MGLVNQRFGFSRSGVRGSGPAPGDQAPGSVAPSGRGVTGHLWPVGGWFGQESERPFF